jgi:hypothetical protein
MRARNSEGYGGLVLGIWESSTHSGKDSTKRDQLRRPRKPTACRAYDFQLPGQDLNLRPSGYEAPEEGLQGASGPNNPAESFESLSSDSVPPMQAVSPEHKNFGQPVVSESAILREHPLTPAQAAARFEVPEYLLRKACSDGRLPHLRVVNALWLSPSAAGAFAAAWRSHK